jgi:DNA-binding NtrC family response regulator
MRRTSTSFVINLTSVCGKELSKKQAMEPQQKILVVDDEPSTRKCLQTLLKVDGYEVEVVSNGKDAISTIENGDRPDFIILDYLMPDMNGLQTLEELMRLDRSLDVIMTSCFTDFATIAEAIRLGARDYLVIPYEKAELNASMLRIKLSKQDQLLECRWVERQISPLSMKDLAQLWSTSNL